MLMTKSRTFAGIPEEYSYRDTANIYLQSIPYASNANWGSNAATRAFDAFLESSECMELYDVETDSEVFRRGIHILDNPPPFADTKEMYRYTYANAKNLLKEGSFLTFFGGDHSVSIGTIKAFYERFEGLTVLQLDAHADLRPTFDGTSYHKACAMHDVSKNCNLIQVGLRSMDVSEKKYMNYEQTYFAHDIMNHTAWIDMVISQMTDLVYITFDVSVFDSAIMPSTAYPEPGGLSWHSINLLLKNIFAQKNVVGFDMVELQPIAGMQAPQYLVAKLYYKMLSYKYATNW